MNMKKKIREVMTKKKYEELKRTLKKQIALSGESAIRMMDLIVRKCDIK